MEVKNRKINILYTLYRFKQIRYTLYRFKQILYTLYRFKQILYTLYRFKQILYTLYRWGHQKNSLHCCTPAMQYCVCPQKKGNWIRTSTVCKTNCPKRSKKLCVYFFKVYFCKVYPAFAYSKLCELISID